MNDDRQLLEEFVAKSSEGAFRALVDRHLPLVYGTARRVTGDPDLAEDLAQTTFILLAKYAGRLKSNTSISGWLYRTAVFTAKQAMRSEQRRRMREQKATAMETPHADTSGACWDSIRTHLDAALHRLSEKDRNALILRYFEERPLREVGQSLGLGEEAAKKRVSRALEKLRHLLGRKGVQISAATLVAGLANEAAQAAPCLELGPKCVTAVVTSSAGGSAVATAAARLANEAISAWRWMRVKAAAGAIAVLSSGLLLFSLWPGAEFHDVSENPGTGTSRTTSSLGSATPATAQVLAPDATSSALLVSNRIVRITVLEKMTKEPIEGAELVSWSLPVAQRTDDRGVAEIPIPTALPMEDRIEQFGITVQAKDYAPRQINWLCSTGGVLRTISSEYTVELEGGVCLAGTVVDESGRPVTGVGIGTIGSAYKGFSVSYGSDGKPSSPPAIREEDFPTYTHDPEHKSAPRTGLDGRFQLAHFPSDLEALVIELVGPEGARKKFRTHQGQRLSAEEMDEVSLQELKTGTARLVFTRGIDVCGVVLDPEGNPVGGATVIESEQLGNLKELARATTDGLGQFCFLGRPAREKIIAVEAARYASLSTIVQVREGMPRLTLTLAPEQPVFGRVVDEMGQGIGGASVSIVDYASRGVGLKWSGATDADGRFEWRSAPTNELALSVSAAGFMQRMARVRATEKEHVITLKAGFSDRVRFTGKVTDAETGDPIPTFSVKVFRSHLAGSGSEGPCATACKDGILNVEIFLKDIPPHVRGALTLLVEADGYEVAGTESLDLEEGDRTMDFALKRGGILTGITLAPNGERAANGQLAFAFSSKPVMWQGRNLYIAENSDAQGRFSVRKPFGASALVVCHSSGWAVVPIQELSPSAEVRLSRWARIEGVARTSGSPTAGESVMISEVMWDWSAPLQAMESATTDNEGRFVFDRVPPGDYLVSLQPARWQRPSVPTVSTLQTPVQVSAGETKSVEIGQPGCKVHARLLSGGSASLPDRQTIFAVLRRDTQVPPEPHRFNYITPESHTAARLRYLQDPSVRQAVRASRTYIGEVSEQGALEFVDVVPGRYILEISFRTSEAPDHSFSMKAAAPVFHQIVEVEGNPGTEIDLGEFRLGRS